MKGYSRMKNIHSPFHSRSMEPNSDQWTPFQEHSNSKKTIDQESSSQELQESGRREIKNHENYKNENVPGVGYEESKEEIFQSSNSRSKLWRNSSVSSASDNFHSAVRKTFSMRRSTSVVDRYCRIYDQSPTQDADAFVTNSRSIKKNNTSARILKACKKLIGM